MIIYFIGDVYMAKSGFRYHSGNWLTDDITLVRKKIHSMVDIHMHSFYEIEFIIGGSGTTVLNGQSYKLGVGSLMLLTPIDFHSVIPDSYLEIINLSFHDNVVRPQLQSILVTPNENILLQLNGKEADTFCQYTELLKAELYSNDKFSEGERENLLNTILVLIARYMRVTDNVAPCADVARLQSSIRYILKNFTQNIKLSDVAAQSGYTPNYFSKLFCEFTGRTYISFLNALRVNYARMLLLSSEVSVLEIAQNSGFNSLSNFTRVFKEVTNQTPVAYRKQRKAGYGI